MRTQLILLVVFLTFSQVYAQQALEQKITIQFSAAEAEEVIEKLSETSGWKFSYNPDALPNQTISRNYQQKTLGYILNDLLGEGFQFKIRGSYLIIQHDPLHTQKKTINVSGKIVDAKTGTSLEDVSVYEVNNLTASLSKKDGTYELTAPIIDRYTVLAVSKENYRDTVIRVSDLSQALETLKLQPLDQPTDTVEESRFFKFLKNKEAKEHNKNITLQEVRPIQVSLLPVAGTNGLLGGKIANRFSLNLIAGYSHSLRGVEIGGAVNIEKADVKGVQIAGASNLVGSRVKGVQIAGASNTNLNEASGVIIGGAMNNSGAAKGVQIAGAYNYVKYKMEGWQVSGGINYAGELAGVQLGIVNIAKKAEKGVMIGIINLSNDGFARFELDHNDVTDYNITFKSGRSSLYSIFTSGITPWANNPLWSYGMGFGTQWYFFGKPFVALEATSHTIQPLERHISGLSIDNRLGITLGYQLFEHLSIEGGPLVHHYLFANKKERNKTFYESIGGNTFAEGQKQKAWVGYRFAIRF